jgi:hypothetical protein
MLRRGPTVSVRLVARPGARAAKRQADGSWHSSPTKHRESSQPCDALAIDDRLRTERIMAVVVAAAQHYTACAMCVDAQCIVSTLSAPLNWTGNGAHMSLAVTLLHAAKSAAEDRLKDAMAAAGVPNPHVSLCDFSAILMRELRPPGSV